MGKAHSIKSSRRFWLGNWILFEEASHESGVEIRADLDNLSIAEPAKPAVAVIESEAIPGDGQGVQLDDGPIAAGQGVFDVELRAVAQDFIELLESVREKIGFAVVMAGKGMGSLDGPIDVIGDVGEEFTAVAALKGLEDFANTIDCDGHVDLSF
jgi:hypothetical protein